MLPPVPFVPRAVPPLEERQGESSPASLLAEAVDDGRDEGDGDDTQRGQAAVTAEIGGARVDQVARSGERQRPCPGERVGERDERAEQAEMPHPGSFRVGGHRPSAQAWTAVSRWPTYAAMSSIVTSSA
jgi:hypothetical protein